MVNDDNICVLNVPGVNGLEKTRGTRNAGKEILEGLNVDYIDLKVDNFNVEEQEKVIYRAALEKFNGNERVLFLGGDHSISYSTCNAFLDHCNKNNKKSCLIVFDAHVDCMIPMKNPTHEEWLRALIEKGFDIDKIVIIGARKIYDYEEEFLKENFIKIISVEEIRENKELVLEELKNFCGVKDLYVSIDIDVFDPKFVKGTYYLEEDGLSINEVEFFVDGLKMFEGFRAADLVEINLDRDDGETINVGRSLLKRLIG
jgi:arginase